MVPNECEKQTRIPHCDWDFTKSKTISTKSKIKEKKATNVRHFDTFVLHISSACDSTVYVSVVRILIFCLIMYPSHVKKSFCSLYFFSFFFFFFSSCLVFLRIRCKQEIQKMTNILHRFMSNASISSNDDKLE